MKETKTIITVKNLTKKFKDTVAINDISFCVSEGETLGIIGESGSGKTTLIRTMLGNLQATFGSSFIEGVNIANDPISCKKVISYLPSEFNLFDLKKGSDFLKFIAKIDNSDKKTANELIKRFQLDIDATPKRMSKGMKQKMALVSCFMKTRNIFVLDEPSIGLDPSMREELYKVLIELKNKGKTIIFSSNDYEEVMLLADRVLVMSKGIIKTIINLKDLKTKNFHVFKFKIFEKNNYDSIWEKIYDEGDGYLTTYVEAHKIPSFCKKMSKYDVIEFKVVPFNLESYIHTILRGNTNEEK